MTMAAFHYEPIMYHTKSGYSILYPGFLEEGEIP